jgi:hypothetical protein
MRTWGFRLSFFLGIFLIFIFGFVSAGSAESKKCVAALALADLYPVQKKSYKLGKLISHLHELRQIYRAVASADTAYCEKSFASSVDPLTSHCGAVAYSLREIFGGQVFSGSTYGHRGIFNRLPMLDGTSFGVDLTRGQYPNLTYASFTPGNFKGVREFETNGNEKMKLFHQRALQLIGATIPHWRVTVRQLEENDFPTDRGIHKRGSRDRKSYSDFFGEDFSERLSELTPNQTWLDVGAGELNAAHEFFELSKGRHISINAHSPSSPVFYRNGHRLSSERQWTYFEGRIFEDISDKELGKLDVITDVYSALSYSMNFDLVLRRYLSLLKQGSGDLFIVLRDGSVIIEDQEGQRLSLLDYFNQIDGILVEKIGAHSYRLTRKRSPLIMPRLQLVQYLARNEEEKRWVPVRKLKIAN